ncbi:GDSL family lipase [Ramlibacter henchirensis]|uniref:GDSL family lipase n=1 Tax=Ramlibacter henchirensis TaxID=204072 RepID=A0A4Z0C7K1_9BURK|nr:SGNH/GDSL hydrolase family protein [Ramlibacter henchirensis]TFZ06882.1 GDSL family lipase [Ramlibacter henchirensis]
MPFPLRRALLTAACALPIVLAACGGGDIVSEFQPTRVVAFGDAFADAGQRGVRYTINDAGATNWTQQLAGRYGLTLAPSNGGGTSFATGSARISVRPDAGGDAATPSITEQIGTFLAAGAPGSGDLVVLAGGVADILVQMAALNAGSQSQAQAIEAVRQAGRELGAQARRLVDAGADRLIVVGPYNLGRSPWAKGRGQEGFVESLTTEFNNALKISIANLGANVLYVDAALHFNLVTAAPAGFGFTDVTTVACNSVDAGAGIGIGAGQVNSALCTGGTLATGAPGTTLFADPVYFTPAGNVSFGNYAFDRARERW